MNYSVIYMDLHNLHKVCFVCLQTDSFQNGQVVRALDRLSKMQFYIRKRYYVYFQYSHGCDHVSSCIFLWMASNSLLGNFLPGSEQYESVKL